MLCSCACGRAPLPLNGGPGGCAWGWRAGVTARKKRTAGGQAGAMQRLPLDRQRRYSRPHLRGRFRRLRPGSPGRPAAEPRAPWRESCSALIPAVTLNIGQPGSPVKGPPEKNHAFSGTAGPEEDRSPPEPRADDSVAGYGRVGHRKASGDSRVPELPGCSIQASPSLTGPGPSAKMRVGDGSRGLA